MRFLLSQCCLLLVLTCLSVGCGGDKSKPTPGVDGGTPGSDAGGSTDAKKDLPTKKDSPTGAVKPPPPPPPPADWKKKDK